MPIVHYLAMTEAEMTGCSDIPPHTAWMSCHFSSSGTGLTDLPRQLPGDSLLILDDSTPIADHDLDLIAAQLAECIRKLHCTGLLLDFQRPGYSQAQELALLLCDILSCPVAVSEFYARDIRCPVFLSPVAPDESISSKLSCWPGREIWLDVTREAMILELDHSGCIRSPLPAFLPPLHAFHASDLDCHYQISLSGEKAIFTLWRTAADVASHLQKADDLGICRAIGLYQEFKHPLSRGKEGEKCAQS